MSIPPDENKPRGSGAPNLPARDDDAVFLQGLERLSAAFVKPLARIATQDIQSRERVSVRQIELAEKQMVRRSRITIIRHTVRAIGALAGIGTVVFLVVTNKEELALKLVLAVLYAGGAYGIGRLRERQLIQDDPEE